MSAMYDELVRQIHVLQRRMDDLVKPEIPVIEEEVLTPLYDSGWVLSTNGVTHTFTHNLGALPLLWTILAADDSGGTDPCWVLNGCWGSDSFGAMVKGLTTTTLILHQAASGIAYNGTKWYVRGTDYIRLLIWATA